MISLHTSTSIPAAHHSERMSNPSMGEPAPVTAAIAPLSLSFSLSSAKSTPLLSSALSSPPHDPLTAAGPSALTPQVDHAGQETKQPEPQLSAPPLPPTQTSTAASAQLQLLIRASTACDCSRVPSPVSLSVTR